MDFFTTEVWTPLGLTTYYILFLIDLQTRRAHVAGLTTTPDGAFMAQVARNLTDPEDGFLRAHHFVICDRTRGGGNETLDSAPRSTEGELRCTERLGGLLTHDARAA